MADEPLAGQILDVDPAPRSIVGRGNKSLIEARNVLFRSWVRDSRNLRRPLKNVSDELAKLIEGANFVPDGSRLTLKSLQEIGREASRLLGPAFDQIDEEIQKSSSRAVSRAIRAQQKYLDSLGLKKLSRSEVRSLEKSILSMRNKEFPPGSGMTYADRMRRVELQHSSQLAKSLRRSHAKDAAMKGIVRDVNVGLTHSGPGRTPLYGGSATRKFRRMMVAEETRLANEAELALVKMSGLDYAYWRLNPNHKWYGGQEICEWYAYRVDPDVVAELEAAGVNTGSMSLEGLHNVSKWPGYPHPFCGCGMEPWTPSGSRRIK